MSIAREPGPGLDPPQPRSPYRPSFDHLLIVAPIVVALVFAAVLVLMS